MPLNSDDDKCLTRYVYGLGWKIAIQFDPNAVLETTVETGMKYLHQCLRWARAHWRGNFTVMENEKYWCSREMLWGTYVIYFGSFLTPAIIWEGVMWLALYGLVGGARFAFLAYIFFAMFIFASKIVKYIPHFTRHPQDMVFIPVAIAFSYFHGFLNLYCLATMEQTHWGSRDLSTVSAAKEGINMAVEVVHEVKVSTFIPSLPSRCNVLIARRTLPQATTPASLSMATSTSEPPLPVRQSCRRRRFRST